ncbi:MULTISPECIES: hypothetical protein [unclassified Oleiphilus]|jgi:hypothetical protein|uniref:hypothetical protein n=1 Tax=unclassified Oleiphilus TaxID=2631174 RepID=UPI0007C20ED5|nr:MULTISPECIES: hypothetical protein [unclassified Oleiphilus]KZY48166.1 hypothetical protein A3732_00780 [Oleiphilus sp. HI0050]KZY66616.1 hypothetical protein A3735_06990 [Oleiphilus sp. HI0061]KZZ34843.1 hypothetical protein A3756_17110 [Oleiphilus sp. HI0086]
MFSVFRNKTDLPSNLEFEQIILELPEEQRSIDRDKTDLIIGVPQTEHNGYKVLDGIPRECTSVSILLGGKSLHILEALVKSGLPQQLRSICIGHCDYTPPGSSFNYEKAIEILSGTSFPLLEHLSLGIDELYCNRDGWAPSLLGDLTSLLESLHSVESLVIHGNFRLDRPILFKRLRNLEIITSDGEPLTSKTHDNLLTSGFSVLEDAWLSLGGSNISSYTFPDIFINAENLPHIKRLEIDGMYSCGQLKRFRESKLCNKSGIKVFSEELEENLNDSSC